jgi:hypothetical protein
MVFAVNAFGQSPASSKINAPTASAVSSSFFGTHVIGDDSALPPANWFGQFRLWDTGTNWFQIEKHPSVVVNSVSHNATTGKSTLYVPGQLACSGHQLERSS